MYLAALNLFNIYFYLSKVVACSCTLATDVVTCFVAVVVLNDSEVCVDFVLCCNANAHSRWKFSFQLVLNLEI
jgi:hypothetical protein